MNLHDLKAHPAAALFPMLDEMSLQRLARDIKQHGLRSPIVLVDGGEGWQVLDGRNRLAACKLAGVAPTHVVWDGRDPVSYVVSTNMERRHLSESQRALVAGRIARLRSGQRQSAAPIGAAEKSQSDAAALLNVSRRNVQRARQVLDDGVPELIAAVERGEAKVSAAAAVSKLPRAEQRKIVESGRVRAAAKESIADPPSNVRILTRPTESALVREWDAAQFLSEADDQVREWGREWLRNEPNARRLIGRIRGQLDLMEKVDAKKNQGNG